MNVLFGNLVKSAFLTSWVFVVGGLQCFSQVHISKKLVWHAPETIMVNGSEIKRLGFEGCNRYDSTEVIPLVDFSCVLDGWDYLEEKVVAQLVVDKWDVLTEEETRIVTNFKVDDVIAKQVFVESKIPILRGFFAPIVFDDSLGVFKKATSLSIIVDFGKLSQHPLKSVVVSYAPNSVLAQGKWVKISVNKTGVYKIPYSKLSSWGFSNPSKIRVYGQGGKMLPRKNSDARVDDLVENAVWHNNNTIYFYAQGPVEWSFNSTKGMFTHKLHDYADKGYYFLTEMEGGENISSLDENSLSYNTETSEFDDFDFYEIEKNSVLNSGSRWLGERFGTSFLTDYSLSFKFPNTVTSSPARISTECVSRSGASADFRVYLNGSSSATQIMYLSAVDMYASTGTAAREGRATTNFYPTTDEIPVVVQYNYSYYGSQGYLDKVDIQVRRKLKLLTPQTLFRDRQTVGPSYVTKFNLDLADASMVVWDVSNPYKPVAIALQGTGTTKWFVKSTSELKEFVAFNPSGDILVPEYAGEVANQNLHGIPQVDYLIVTTPLLLAQAQKLAEIHEQISGLSTAVVTQDQIFNEFSSGCPDVTAIRSFARMFYDRAGSDKALMPRYLLLFGDGSYDNRNAQANNKVLTFQSDNSLEFTGTYVSDDYFGFLDASEGSALLTDAIDIGVGRLPASTVADAKAMVAKTSYYMQQQINNGWRNRITFVADDEDGNIHMTQADQLAQKVELNEPEFNLGKIFFDAYPKVTTSNGQRYPDVNLLVEKAFADGTLIFNYTGHGSAKGLSAERIITNESIQKLTNIDRLPLFMTATCEFSAYDQEETSAGELVLLNPKGGGIGLLTTTRVVYSNQNFEINNQFFNYALNKDEDGLPLRLGDIVKLTKRATSGTVNKMNFSLLGDPALRLGSPWLGVQITQINDKEITSEMDTLKAFSVIKIAGKVVDANGNLMPTFNGTATITVYDKRNQITTLGNSGNTPFVFDSFESILFSGKVAVTDGEFTSVFKMPKDIRYDYGEGRISVFATNEILHASGLFDQVVVGGIADAEEDTKGPDISMWLNSSTFEDGAVVGPAPLLIADIFDVNGINTSNNGIGHDIVLMVDEGNTARYVISNYFEAQLGSYERGGIEYQLPELSDGIHTLTLKVWDTYNNSSSKTITFRVKSTKVLGVEKANIYPCPVKPGQPIHLSITHDDPNASVEATCTIIAFSGLKAGVQTQTLYTSGTTTNEMEIQTVYANGQPLGQGIYLLKVDLMTETGKKTQINQKIIVAE